MWVGQLSRRVLQASTGFCSFSICSARKHTSMCSPSGSRGCRTMYSCSSAWQRLETNVNFAFTASMSYLKELYTVYLDSFWWQKTGNGSSLSSLLQFSSVSFSSDKLRKKIERIKDLLKWKELSTSSKHMQMTLQLLQMMTLITRTKTTRLWLISKKLRTAILTITSKMEHTLEDCHIRTRNKTSCSLKSKKLKIAKNPRSP